MRKYPIRADFGLPMVSAVIVGPKGSSRVELVFDSGSADTQLHIGTLASVGLTFTSRRPDITIRGVIGRQKGYSCSLQRLHLLGMKHNHLAIAAFDFSEWAEEGIDGLLGWDLIQKLHFEVDGPRKILRIF